MARKRTPAPPPSQPGALTQERAEEFAARVIRDPGFTDFLQVLELDLFNQWRATLHDKDAAARAVTLQEGMRVVMAKLQELAHKPRGDQ